MNGWLPWVLCLGFLILLVVALFSDAPTAALLAVAACLTAVSGFITALTALRKSRNGKNNDVR